MSMSMVTMMRLCGLGVLVSLYTNYCSAVILAQSLERRLLAES